MNTKHSIHKTSKKFIWILFALIMASMACGLSDIAPAPTAIVYPTAVVVSTSPPPPTAEPTPEQPQPPSIEILLDLTDKETVVGKEVFVEYIATNEAGISYIELTIDSVDGQSLTTEGSFDAPLNLTEIRSSLAWTPGKPGEYTLDLSVYDLENLAKASHTIKVMVYSLPEIITHGNVFLGQEESYDFVTGQRGHLEGGDLYVYNLGDSIYTVGANNDPQIGGVLLFAAGELDLTDSYTADHLITEAVVIKKILSTEIQANVAAVGDYLEKQDLYLFKRNQAPGEYILFTVDAVNSDGVMLNYVVFKMPE